MKHYYIVLAVIAILLICIGFLFIGNLNDESSLDIISYDAAEVEKIKILNHSTDKIRLATKEDKISEILKVLKSTKVVYTKKIDSYYGEPEPLYSILVLEKGFIINLTQYGVDFEIGEEIKSIYNELPNMDTLHVGSKGVVV